MEQITYHVDKDILYIAIAGRVDASNAPAVEQEISCIKSENTGRQIGRASCRERVSGAV